MSLDKVIRAWRDPEFRKTLSEQELSLLPLDPSGEVALTEEDLKEAAGGTDTVAVCISIGVSLALCWSIVGGGSCQVVGTAGCCH